MGRETEAGDENRGERFDMKKEEEEENYMEIDGDVEGRKMLGDRSRVRIGLTYGNGTL